MANSEDVGSPPVLRVAVLGCGTVGTEVIRHLREQSEELTERSGARLTLSAVVVRRPGAPRDDVVPTDLVGTDPLAAVDDADIVVEVMGGIEPAREVILHALRRGKSVVTANKALLGRHGAELAAQAQAAGVDLNFEAAVAGAVPVVRGVRESLAGDTITRILGIVNGTTNYILDEMTQTGSDFDQALSQAQELGYAESDPTDDIEGYDAAAKAAILASLAFHSRVRTAEVHVEGIGGITPSDIESARASGHVLKLLAIAEQSADPRGLAVRVHPALVPTTHPLASVHGAYNAVLVQARAAGDLMFYGAGAGGAPTASAVVGDLVEVARHRVAGVRGPAESDYADLGPLGPEHVYTRYQVRLEVRDEPGVLATLASTVAEHGVSIETARQGTSDAGLAVLVLITHLASEESLTRMVSALSRLEAVAQVSSVLRVEGH